jgi:putative ABC transport system permease protein
MKLRYQLQESVQALRANVMRSSLTIIGIVVGIFSVTAMLALGAGLSANVLDRISSFSQGDLSITGTLTPTDLAWVNAQPYTTAAIGTMNISATNAIVLGESFTVTTQAVLGDLVAVQKIKIASGTMYDFTDLNYTEPVAVISGTLDAAVQKKTGTSALGQSIIIGSQQYTVIGVTAVADAGFTRNDGTVYIPYRTALSTLAGTANFSTIGVKLKDPNEFDVTGKDVLAGLNASRYLAPDSSTLFRVSTAQSIIESTQQTTTMISLFLGIVGGIALFVGGIGTMNMMLTTVTERTKEIGLRKSIGARRSDILLQILFESVFLTVLGGAIGILLTVVAAYFANKAFADSNLISVVVSSQVIMLATAVAIAVGVIFGLYPANRASKLQPVDALRAE